MPGACRPALACLTTSNSILEKLLASMSSMILAANAEISSEESSRRPIRRGARSAEAIRQTLGVLAILIERTGNQDEQEAVPSFQVTTLRAFEGLAAASSNARHTPT